MGTIQKLSIILATLLAPAGSALADEYCGDDSPMIIEECCCPDWRVELRTAYFYPTSSLERDIYDGARFDAEVEFAAALLQNVDFWANLTYFQKTGKSVGLHERTTLKLIPLTLGLKYICPISCCMSLYAGCGVNYTWMELHDDTDVGPKHTNKSRVGATWASGMYYQINERWFSDLFVDYLYIPMKLSNVSNVGGFRFGIGLGMHI